MIWSLFGLMLLAYAYENSKENNESSHLMMWVCIIMGTGLIANDLYVGLLLPWQIGSMYNNGTGISYNGTARFGNNDTSVAYFMAQTKNEWVFMEYVKMIAVMLGSLFVLVFVWNAMKQPVAFFTGASKKVK